MKRKGPGRLLKNMALTLVVLVIAGLIGGGIYYFSLLSQIKQKPLAEKTPEELGIAKEAPKESDTGVVNILLFGLDSRVEGEASRSDTIMIATINKKNKSVKLTSLMRDMYVKIPGKQDNRINAAYAFGGPGLAIKTVNTNFQLDIRRYVTVDFFALEKIIDKLGGVSIDVKNAEVAGLNRNLDEINAIDMNSAKVPHITKGGLQVLNGRQAVAYSRIRHTGNGDYERTERQRTVLNQLFIKTKEAGILKLPDLVSTVLSYTETNMSKGEITALGMSVMTFGKKEAEQYRLPVDGTFKPQKIRGMDVLVPDIPQNTEKLHRFIYSIK